MNKNTLVFAFLGALFFTGMAKANEGLGPFSRSLASEADYDNAITPSLGLNRGQPAFSVDYERRLTSNFGFGGYFYFTPEKKTKLYPKVLTVGADFKAHISVESLDFYLHPASVSELLPWVAKIQPTLLRCWELAPFFEFRKMWLSVLSTYKSLTGLKMKLGWEQSTSPFL